MFRFYFDYDSDYFFGPVAHYDLRDVTTTPYCGEAAYSEKDIKQIIKKEKRQFLNDIIIFEEKCIVFKPHNTYVVPYNNEKLINLFYSEFKNLLNMNKDEFSLLLELKKGE